MAIIFMLLSLVTGNDTIFKNNFKHFESLLDVGSSMKYLALHKKNAKTEIPYNCWKLNDSGYFAVHKTRGSIEITESTENLNSKYAKMLLTRATRDIAQRDYNAITGPALEEWSFATDTYRNSVYLFAVNLETELKYGELYNMEKNRFSHFNPIEAIRRSFWSEYQNKDVVPILVLENIATMLLKNGYKIAVAKDFHENIEYLTINHICHCPRKLTKFLKFLIDNDHEQNLFFGDSGYLNSPFMQLIEDDNVEAVKYIFDRLTKTLDLSVYAAQGEGPSLFHAVKSAEMVEALAKNIRELFGEEFLNYLINKEHDGMLERGMTPLMTHMENFGYDMDETVDMMERAVDNPPIERSRLPVCKALIKFGADIWKAPSKCPDSGLQLWLQSNGFKTYKNAIEAAQNSEEPEIKEHFEQEIKKYIAEKIPRKPTVQKKSCACIKIFNCIKVNKKNMKESTKM